MDEVTTIAEKPPLTHKQRAMLAAIVRYAQRHGQYPTFRNLMAILGIKYTSCITSHITSLRKKGFVRPSVKDYDKIRVIGMGLDIADDEDGRRLREAIGEEAT